MAALSYVYDNGLEKSVVQKAIVGFRWVRSLTVTILN